MAKSSGKGGMDIDFECKQLEGRGKNFNALHGQCTIVYLEVEGLH